MCYHYSPAHLSRLQKLYPDKFGDIEFTNYANGFTHPAVPTLTAKEAGLKNWGLIPHWCQDEQVANKMKRYCLNAKIETLSEKPSFRDAVAKNQFCVLPAKHFYEWQWQDAKGKEKIKFEIKLRDDLLLHLAGLYSSWLNQKSGELIETITIITCEANEIMAKIHNTKKRMPIILNPKEGQKWIHGELDLAQIKLLAQGQQLEAQPTSI